MNKRESLIRKLKDRHIQRELGNNPGSKEFKRDKKDFPEVHFEYIVKGLDMYTDEQLRKINVESADVVRLDVMLNALEERAKLRKNSQNL